jgi:DNA-binding transcriptional MerR regulator
MNGGELEDIYKAQLNDFTAPATLEVSYEGPHGIQREIVFVDPIYADKRPRICVSVDGIQAMHNAISVLSRKVDNLVTTLRNCRTAYYKQLQALRHGQASDLDFFNPESYAGDRDHSDKLLKTNRELDEYKDTSEHLELERQRLEKQLHARDSEIRDMTEKEILAAEPKSMMKELLSSMSVEQLVKSLRLCLPEAEREDYPRAVAAALKDQPGFSIAGMEQMLEAERGRQSVVESELAAENSRLTSKASDLEHRLQELADAKQSCDVQVTRLADRLEETQKGSSSTHLQITAMKQEISKLEKDAAESQLVFDT